MKRRDWAGMAAFVIAFGLAFGWCAATIIAFTPWTPDVTSEAAQLLNGVGQVLAGALATYLGTQIVGRRDHPPVDAPEPEILFTSDDDD